MLVIKTPFGDFGHPKDLRNYMKDENLLMAYVKVQYCFEDIFEKNMSFNDVSRWAENYVSPIAGTLEEAIKWLRLGGV